MTNRDRRQRRAPSRHRRRGNLGFDYREVMLMLNPETAKRIDLTARSGPSTSRNEPALFDLDHVSYTP